MLPQIAGDQMTCPTCGAAVPADQWKVPSRGDAAKAVLSDWRTWAGSLAAFAAVGLVTGLVGVGHYASAGAGGFIGMMVAVRMTRLRTCPSCSAIVTPNPD